MIEVYGKKDCKYCVAAKDFLEKNDLEYYYYDVGVNVYFLKMLKERLPGVKTVPQIWIKDKHIGGYEDLLKVKNLKKYKMKD